MNQAKAKNPQSKLSTPAAPNHAASNGHNTAQAYAEQPSDEIVIDLRGILLNVAQYWRLILSGLLIGALLGLVGVTLFPPPFEAVASVAIVKMRTEVTTDSKIRTISPDAAPASTAAQDRRSTLVALVSNGAIAQTLAAKYSGRLAPEDREPARLMAKISASAAQSSKADVIDIKVRDRDAQLAADIANDFVREYERMINAIYAGSTGDFGDSLKTEVERARKEFDAAQGQLELFIVNSNVNALGRQIKDRQIVLDALQKGLQATISQVVDQEVKLRTNQINDYQNAQSQNQQVLFQHEQNAKRAMLQTLLQAESDGKLKSVSEQIQVGQKRLTALYASKLLLERLGEDARLMREALKTGGSAAAASNRIALQLLKVQVSNASTALPANLQLQVQSADAADAEAQIADLTALSAALAERVKQIEAQIGSLGRELATTGGYERAEAVGARVSSVEPAAFANASPLNADIVTLYQSLYTLGAYSKLADGVAKDNPLSQQVQKRASELQQLTASVLTPQNGATEAQILQIEKEVRELQAKVEQEQVALFKLTQRRDLARSNFTALATKQAEVEISNSVFGSEVRVASPAVVPYIRTTARSNIVVIATLAGALVGILAAMLLGWLKPIPTPRRLSRSPVLRWLQQAVVPAGGTD